MELKQRIALAIVIITIGLGAGHIMQNVAPKKNTQQARLIKPTKVTHLAASGVSVTAPVVPVPAAPALSSQATSSQAAAPQAVPAANPAPEVAVAGPAAADCPVRFDLVAQPSAMLGLALVAPCRAGQRVVLRHGGLAVTARTSVTGSLFLDFPAMTQNAEMSVLFANGESVEASTMVPELADIRRFGVQWMANDAFQIHAFENGADYGEPGDVSAQSPHTPLAGVPSQGGYLTLVGNGSVDLPMLAEVYTFPANDTKVEVVVEAAVTIDTCGRDVLGETLSSEGGEVVVTDLTLAMPECEAVGDILMLKNLVMDRTLAAN